MCILKAWNRGTKPLCSLQKESYETFLPPIPPFPFLHFTLPDEGCALTFAGIIFLCIWIFLALYVLSPIYTTETFWRGSDESGTSSSSISVSTHPPYKVSKKSVRRVSIGRCNWCSLTSASPPLTKIFPRRKTFIDLVSFRPFLQEVY